MSLPHPTPGSHVADTVEKQVGQVKQVLESNLKKVVERGEDVNAMQHKSDDMMKLASDYKNKAGEV